MPNCQVSVSWIALIAALGVGTIMAAVVGWWSAKAVAISNHRQNWINALREDLAQFLKEVDVLHYRVARLAGSKGSPATVDDLDKQQDARNSAMLAYRRILMRLNMNEASSIELGERLNDLMIVSSAVADSQRIDAVLSASRKVLKQEWEVTKYGIFTWIMRLKNRRFRKIWK